MSRRFLRPLLLCSAALVVTACGSDPNPYPCLNIACGACAPAVWITIVSSSGEAPTVRGDIDLQCTTDGTETTCMSQSLSVEPGTYTFDITAPGDAPAQVTLELRPGGSGCCACPVIGGQTQVMLHPLDAGT